MRLKEKEKQVIIQAVKSIDPKARLYLFGSRVDDSRKGGDIDLLVFSDKMTYGDKLKVKKSIFTALEDQKIDLFVSKDADKPFVNMALEQGVRLA
ncbi:MAG: nucleotidyltransferase domain-containing protein [bacterium]|nr:nucleotidyltransferase domain-containing protein [bacterium]